MNRHISFTKLSKHWLCRTFVVLLALFVLPPAFAQNTVFVSSLAADDSGDGTTWATAKKTIAAGITAAGGNGIVCVTAGDYRITEELVVPSGVTVMGGFLQSSEGTDTTRHRLPGVNSHWSDTTWCTVVTGAGNHRIATVNGVLDGCVVCNGYSSTIGGGLLIDGGTAQYCVIKECDAINDEDFNAEGGGAYIRNDGVLQNSVVTECRGDNGVGVSGENGYLISNTITRNAPVGCGSVVDYDGNYYSTVLIGDQCWMRENLRTKHFANGVEIVRALSSSNAAPYYYQNNWTDEYISEMGLLYNWNAVMNGAESSNAIPSGVQGICPDGWHVPSQNEWTIMFNYVNGVPRYLCNDRNGQIGKALASRSRWEGTYYNNPCCMYYNQHTNNLTRFSATPTGQFYNNSFEGIGYYAFFWSSTVYNTEYAHFAQIYQEYWGDYGQTNQSYSYKQNGYSVRCIRDNVQEAANQHTIPTVTTNEVSDVAITTATCGGNVVNDGGAEVTARGVCWSTSPNPTVNNSRTSDSTGLGEFTSAMTGLTPSVTYYVRAYATNSWGTGYGESRAFTLQDQPCPGAATLTDADGNSYNTVKIGNQCWMKENLRVKHYADDGSDVTYLYPNNVSATEATYGLLYTWDAVMHGANSSASNPSYVQGICPDDWHVPSQEEWNQLKSYVSGRSEYRCNNYSDYIAKSLASKTGWLSNGSTCNLGYDMNSNNSTGFSAMPAGYVETNGTNYRDFGYNATYWSATNSFRTHLHSASAVFDFNTSSNGYYFSVRCVKD